jgi:hypothetical protein
MCLQARLGGDHGEVYRIIQFYSLESKWTSKGGIGNQPQFYKLDDVPDVFRGCRCLDRHDGKTGHKDMKPIMAEVERYPGSKVQQLIARCA